MIALRSAGKNVEAGATSRAAISRVRNFSDIGKSRFHSRYQRATVAFSLPLAKQRRHRRHGHSRLLQLPLSIFFLLARSAASIRFAILLSSGKVFIQASRQG
jgi:hypothetical protein